MSVEKLDSIKIKQEKIPFTTHLNYVLQNIHDPLPLAIWCYLTSLPDNWNVHRNQLMEHFNIGRDKLGKALKFLNDNKLIEYVTHKNDKGQIQVWQILVKAGYEFEVIHRNESTLLKNQRLDYPESGKTAPTKEIKNTNKIKEKNKSFCVSQEEQKKIKDVDNPKKHSWAEKPAVPTADVTKQSTSFDPEKYKDFKRDPNSPGYQAFLNSVPSLRRKYEQIAKPSFEPNEQVCHNE